MCLKKLDHYIIIHKGDIGKSFFLIEEGSLRESIQVEVEERRNQGDSQA